MKFRRYALITMALASSVAFAGPKAPSSGTAFKPEIGYTYASGKTGELRLSNREGTAAILVYRANTYGGVRRFDLAPPNVDGKNRIAFVETDSDGNWFLKVSTWYYDADGTVKVTTPTLIHSEVGGGNNNTIANPEFSPDGTKLVYLVAPGRRVYVHDFASGGKTDLLVEEGGYSLSWHASGNHLYYEDIVDSKRQIFRVPTNQGLQRTGHLILTLAEIADLDVSRPNSTYYPDGLFVSFRNTTTERWKMAYYADDGVTLGEQQIFLAKDGSPLPALKGHMNCTGSEMIHVMSNTRHNHKGIYNTVTKEVTTWSTDSSIGDTDWMPCEYTPSA